MHLVKYLWLEGYTHFTKSTDTRIFVHEINRMYFISANDGNKRLFIQLITEHRGDIRTNIDFLLIDNGLRQTNDQMWTKWAMCCVDLWAPKLVEHDRNHYSKLTPILW